MKRTMAIALALAAAGLFAAADASAQPRGRRQGARIMQMDENHDGVVDRAELVKGFRGHAALMLRQADRNHDGALDAEEHRAWRLERRAGAPGPRFEARGRALFEATDTNHDGKLSLEELQTAAERRAAVLMERRDGNGDGALDGDELAAWGRGRGQGRR